jgi:hypothetical protein
VRKRSEAERTHPAVARESSHDALQGSVENALVKLRRGRVADWKKRHLSDLLFRRRRVASRGCREQVEA